MKTALFLLSSLLIPALLLSGCRKSFETVDEVQFEVSLESDTFKVGEPVLFSFDGNPDFISFYSGERGKDYAFVNKDRIIETEMTFSFSTTTSSGTKGHPNPSTVPICYSSDFNGDYTEAGVRSATWTEITDRFSLPTDTGVTDLFSGDANITELFPDKDTPLWFCLHYTVEAFDASLYGGAGNGRTQWNFKAPKFNGIAGESVSTIYDINTSNWKIVKASSFEGVPSSSFPDINSSRILLRSDFQPPVIRECWAIAGPIHRMDYINEGPDHGKGIKALAEATLRNYAYTYQTAGEYTITFVAANANVYDRKQTIRQVNIKIINDGGEITPPQPGEWN